MGKGKLEELELSWVKAEGKELGKSKKQKARSSKVILLPLEEDCKLYKKTNKQKKNMVFVAQLTTGCGFGSEVELRTVSFSTLRVSSCKLLPTGHPTVPRLLST